MTPTHLLAIDQGTTNSRAIIFDLKGQFIRSHEIALNQSYPQPGWVEQNPDEMFTNTIQCCQQALLKANLKADSILAVGMTNQRETTIIWNKNTGQPIYPAIVWQDRRTADLCSELEKSNFGTTIKKNTGLLLDPYFSATKIMWLLDNVPGARAAALASELLFGTVDTYLLWRMTEGKVHATDITNASRTLLYNIHRLEWDEEIIKALNIPRQLLPEVHDNAFHFGDIAAKFLGTSLPIMGIAGDQQAATIGQACFKEGMVKATYGTGCFMMVNIGAKVHTQPHLLTTVAYRIKNEMSYGLEGSIFSAGLVVKWLRDNLNLIKVPAETEDCARSLSSNDGVYLVPAFTGMGAPYWDPHARGAILGLTRDTSKAHIARAALESTVYQTVDLLKAMTTNSIASLKTLRVDGGMTANSWMLQFLSNMIDIEVQKPVCIETTALGVAYLAGLQAGVYHSLEEVSSLWKPDSTFQPSMSEQERNSLYTGWKKAVARVVSTPA